MGAAEAGREIGDSGGPVLVGAFGLVSLTVGFGALGAALLICVGLNGLAQPRQRTPSRGRWLVSTGPAHRDPQT